MLLLYSIAGVIIRHGIPGLLELPLRLAGGLAQLSAKRRLWGFVYIFGVFLAIPAGLLAVAR